MKKRWSYLREQYVRHLKQTTNPESDKPSKRNYKYFHEMSFLANHVQIRNSNYHDTISHIVYEPHNGKSKIARKHRTEEDNVNNVVDNENVDFVITENEIEAYNDDDDDNLFVELSDEESVIHSNDSWLASRNSSKPAKQTHAFKQERENVPTKLEATILEDENRFLLQEPEPQLPTNNAVIVDKSPQKNAEMKDARCEDVIFGELVTSMLKKMDSPNRKRAKKEILNILLS